MFMDLELLLERYKPLLTQYFVPIVIGIVGLICLSYGLMSLSTKPLQQNHLLSEAASTKATDTSVSLSQKAITVDIEGSVIKPGIYQLPATSRVQDVLIAAGGLSENADRGVIAKSLNLASPVSDGAKIYIPTHGEQVIVGGTQEVAGSATKIVNINQASLDELDGLPGIGQTTAQKIIANRPYQNTQELVQKKSIGEKEFEKIKDSIVAQ